MAVTKRLRYEVLRRDNHTCRYCGASAPDVKLTIDHVTPVALGGRDEPANLVTACEPCNSGKTSVPASAPIVADVEEDALRWAAAIGKAAEMARANYESRLGYRQTFRDSWDEWQIERDGTKSPLPLDAGWQNSLDAFYEAGLPDWELDEAVRAAMTNQKVTSENTFRYFAGICWTKIRSMQDQARQIIDAGQQLHGRKVSEDSVNEIADRWLSSYQDRCARAGIECNASTQSVRTVVESLLEQGYSATRVSDAAEEAGSYLTGAVGDYLDGWGDFCFDAMLAWAFAWRSVDSTSKVFRKSTPSPREWSDFKAEVQSAVSAGVADVEILAACKAAGEHQFSLLVDLPDWEGRWD